MTGRITFSIIGMIGLSGCFDGGHWMSTEYLTGRGWAKPPKPQQQDPLYCYRTLGEVNCYKAPQTGKGRLIEFKAPAVPVEENETPSPPSMPITLAQPVVVSPQKEDT